MPYKQKAIPGQRYIPKHDKPELRVHKAVCRYLNNHYPGVQYQSDIISGLPLDPSNRRDMQILNLMKALNSDHKHPDLIVRARSADGRFCALALELKAEGTSVVLKIGPNKGKLTSDEHIRQQARTLRQLNAEGWYANFAIGYTQAIQIIDWYFGRQSLGF